MLRIRVHKGQSEIVFELEGRLTGASVIEVEKCWRRTTARLPGHSVLFKLDALQYVDASGKYLLALVRCRGAQLNGSGMAATELLSRLREEWPLAVKKPTDDC